MLVSQELGQLSNQSHYINTTNNIGMVSLPTNWNVLGQIANIISFSSIADQHHSHCPLPCIPHTGIHGYSTLICNEHVFKNATAPWHIIVGKCYCKVILQCLVGDVGARGLLYTYWFCKIKVMMLRYAQLTFQE